MLLIYTEDNAFTVASKAIDTDNQLTFAGLKDILQSRFCGPDYKRALELRLRNLKFKRGTKIAPFVHDLCSTIQELYGLNNEDSIDSIASNHLMSTLDDTIRKETKVLQLAGNVRLESILELISEKLEGNSLGLNISACRETAGSFQSHRNNEDRLSRLETMMSNVIDKLDSLQTSQVGSASGRRQMCEHCQKTGHDKSHCFQLKKCFKCDQVGHIAKFCKSKEENHSAASHVETVYGKGVAQSVVPEKRITVKVSIGKQELDFLYDTGSQHPIMPRQVYEKLVNKPPLSPVNVSGSGISGNKFAIDGVAYLNLQLMTTNGMVYTLEYEPVLVTAAVDTCIFGDSPLYTQ